MKEKTKKQELRPEEVEMVSAGAYSPGAYHTEAQSFLKSHMNAETYDLIMSHRDGRRLPYVAARIYLNGEDWDRYVWIEQHGSLDGFPG